MAVFPIEAKLLRKGHVILYLLLGVSQGSVDVFSRGGGLSSVVFGLAFFGLPKVYLLHNLLFRILEVILMQCQVRVLQVPPLRIIRIKLLQIIFSVF